MQKIIGLIVFHRSWVHALHIRAQVERGSSVPGVYASSVLHCVLQLLLIETTIAPVM